MRNFFLLLLVSSLLFACSFKNQLTYVNNGKEDNISKINFSKKNYIEIGDILKIDVKTALSEVSALYNNTDYINSTHNPDKLILDGYKVEKDSTINYPVLGEISVIGLTINELTIKLRNMLINEGQLTNPHIKINKVNSKFTVLGEVKNPGTYFNYENQLNIFQALGTAGDLLISAKRKNVKLIRQENGLRKTYEFSLNTSEIFDKPYYYIKSNDVIIVEPNYSRIKSAGFIGSPSSIASISSLVLSITLLIINNGN
jgi:polysaccharide export outer membrane protein